MMAETPQAAEPWLELEPAAEERHERKRDGEFKQDECKAQSAELQHVAQQEARAQEHYACLQPELVGGNSGPEYLGDPDGVRHRETDQDGPQHILDVGNVQVIRLGVGRDGLLDELA